MTKIKNFYIIIAIIILMIVRFFVVSCGWFSTIIIAGFLVALFDLIRNVYILNRDLVIDQQKLRFGVIFIILNFLFVVAFILLIINATIGLEFINNMVLDEITLLTLLICLPQNLIIKRINKFVRK